MKKLREFEHVLTVEAVLAWYPFYEVPVDERASCVLRAAAVDLFHEGYETVDEIATILIGTYVGLYATKVNAPTSASVH